MYFKKIDMHGFKSFADPVSIEFSRGLTCVVGPNGSGKSNISDAIRWVLGEQSPKMLRGGKMEEVIFSGTANRKTRGMGEVTLVIDNSDGNLEIDYKEVAITRRMYRSGESEYFINGNQCRLRDIRELIMDTGIGVEGYSIIGQGRISDIVSNKTESRREIFEEAAGIVMYRNKKAESERKLASTNDNIDRVQDIIGEIEGRIESLKEDSVKAKEYLELKENYKKLEINIILKNVEGLELKREYIKDDIIETKIQIDNLKAKKAELEANLVEFNKKNESLDNIVEDKRKELLSLIDELNIITSKDKVNEERIISIADNEKRLAREIEELSQKLERELANRENITENNKIVDQKYNELQRNLEDKILKYRRNTDEITNLLEESEKQKNDVYEMTNFINTNNAEISSLKRLRDTLADRKESLGKEKSVSSDNNKESLDKLNYIRSEKQRIEESLDVLIEARDEKKEKNITSKLREAELSRKLEETRISLGQFIARARTIEEMENNYEGYNYSVKHIMKSNLNGIHGVVADLIEVPRGYEVAIETAMGAAIQNIVCDDERSAKSAIESLKANKAGRMTFLPISSIKGNKNYNEKLRNENGFIGFGPDCIKYDGKYNNIFAYILGRVVIVDNMDSAIRLSRIGAGNRYVTLEGEVINAGGAITGGKYKNKTMNILDRKAEIQTLKEKINQQNIIKEGVTKELEDLRAEISTYIEDSKLDEDNIRTNERNLLEKDHELKLVESLIKDIKNSNEKIENELNSIDIEREKSDKMIETIMNQIAEKKEKIIHIEALNQEVMKEYSEKKETFEKTNEEITAARIEANTFEQEKLHADEMAKRLNDNIEEIKSTLEAKETQLDEFKAERDRIQSKVQTSDTEIKNKEETKKNLEEYLEDISKEKADLARNNSKSTEDNNKVNEDLENARNQKYDLEIKDTRMETQLDTYKNRLWEDFEISYIQAMEFKSDEFVMSSAIKENRQNKSRIKELGDVNVGAIEEYETVKERYDFLSEQKNDIENAADDLIKIISNMDKTIKAKFKESFDEIVLNFEEKFKELFGGGHAELRLSDETNPLESNIDIIAQPPGKKLQNINLLSGGEKTLTAIALMFAVLKSKPTPFCILDEVEAALDDANIDRFISALRKLDDIQFALVTHQKATMEHADVLYGVTMPEKGVSKILSLDMSEDFDIENN